MPEVVGRRPDMKLVRDGRQIGAWQWALVNRTPRLASRSILGVDAWGCPRPVRCPACAEASLSLRQPTQSLRSSMVMSRTWSRVWGGGLSADTEWQRKKAADTVI